MIPGAEHVFTHIWLEWIRAGRRRDAEIVGLGWELHHTRRHRWSLAALFLLFSALLEWVHYVLLRYPAELALRVLAAAAGALWLMAGVGAAKANLERIRIDHVGLLWRRWLRTRSLSWDDMVGFEFPDEDLVIVGRNGTKIRVNSFHDGLGTLSSELEEHFGYLPAVAERLDFEEVELMTLKRKLAWAGALVAAMLFISVPFYLLVQVGPRTDVSALPAHAAVLGTRWRSVRELDAIGITEDRWYRRHIDVVRLAPPKPEPAFDTPEMVSRWKLAAGAELQVTAVQSVETWRGTQLDYVLQPLGRAPPVAAPIVIRVDSDAGKFGLSPEDVVQLPPAPAR
jgi:hypothetical protein